MIALALATLTPVARAEDPSIRWEVDPSGTTSSVSVVGLSPEALAALRADSSKTVDAWPGFFRIEVDAGVSKGGDRPSMLGTYRLEGQALRFTPKYPFDRGKTYRATFRPSMLAGTSGPEITSTQAIPRRAKPATTIRAVTPSAGRVPENLLKFYLFFSGPMSRGEVYDRVRLLKDDGKPVDLPFLRLGEELWDPTGTRLTLLIDPGRIKRGLKPREENGPVLEAGRSYTLVIDQGWLDADGDPLASSFRKTFRAEAADETQPHPKDWKIGQPAASTREPLVLTFPEPLDRALLESALMLVDGQEKVVAGRLEIGQDETRWTFTPEVPWTEGTYSLVIDADLEDLAGNSILRPFEVDVQRDTPSRPEPKLIRVPIAIRPQGP